MQTGLYRRETNSVARGLWWLMVALALCAGSARSAVEAPVADGAALYRKNCSGCHEGAVPRAPHVITFNTMPVSELLRVMNEGAMQQQASALSQDERETLARFLAGADTVDALPVAACTDRRTTNLDADPAAMRGWGGDLGNSRYLPVAHSGLTPQNVQHLKLKWVFAYPGATRARSQPLVHDDVVFVGSQSGTVYALDLDTGCAIWRYEAGAEVRSAPSLAWLPGSDDPLLLFGDFNAEVHAIHARDGSPVWRVVAGDHPDATITGSVKYHDGLLYVPLSSSEWATAADPGYACCTFRGGVVALDADDGTMVWRGHAIEQAPTDTGKRNPNGAPRFGPAGAPIWNTPSIDTDRGLLYVGTGEAYTSPAAPASDAVIAFSLASGDVVWRRQLLSGDAWNMSCFIGSPANCPEENGPDLDVGAATILWQGGKRNLVLAGQKSGDVYALDPDNSGAVVWHEKVGRGGFAGGVHWGMSVNPDNLFVPIADTDFIGKFKGKRWPGLHALDPATGQRRWYTPSAEVCADDTRPLCDPGMSAAPTSSDGLVFAGGFDGRLKAYDARTGEILWLYNTFDTFQAVNGDIAQGGSIESDGPVLYRGHVLVNSGYQFGGRLPGNALMVFALEDDTD